VNPLRPSDLGFDLEDNGARVLVSRVNRMGAAGIAGLREGDMLLSIDGRPIEAAIDLLLAFSASRPGREYFLNIRRAGQPVDVVLVAPK
jgi:S1-C subfamily serine protease